MCIEKDGQRLEGFESDKALGLLAYLVLRNGPVSRQRLAGLFWGEFPDKRARGNLRRVLHNLGKLVPDCLRVERRSVQFKPGDGCCVDVLAFRALAIRQDLPVGPGLPTAAQHLEDALQWFRGPLLDGLSLDDCPEFELWLVTEREHWQQHVVRVVAYLIDYDIRRGDYVCALNHVDQVLQLTPWQEAAHRQKMLLLARTGQCSAALRQYDICRHILRKELDVEPLPETQALYRRLRASRNVARPTLDELPYPTAFIGRERETAAITERLMDPNCRLLTLTGLGGAGKTRLARQVTAQQDAHFLDGVVFVPLTSVASPALLVPAIAETVGLVFQGRHDPREQLFSYLRQREMLLVLDNFEHLLGCSVRPGLPTAAALLADLLCHAPLVKVLVTSRECLNLRWEWVFKVQGLTLSPIETGRRSGDLAEQRRSGDLAQQRDAAAMEAAGAVQLFAHIAQRRRSDFDLARERDAVVHTCHLVEGLPLGIELAAAWTASHTCAEIAQAIAQSLGALQSPLCDMPARHRSIQAVLDYSWQWLSEEERRVFARMACFEGDFSAPAAAHVAGTTPALLTSLVDKSLLRQASPPPPRGRMRGGENRYAMHNLAHRYAEEQLARLGSAAEAEAQAAHGHYYFAQLQRWASEVTGPRQVQTLDAMQRDLGNLRRAWQWAVDTRAYDDLDRGLGAFFDFFAMRSRFREGYELFAEAATRLHDTPSTLLGKVLARLGAFHYRLGQYPQATAHLEESLALLRTAGAASDVAFSLAYRGSVAYATAAYDEARDFFQEALALYRQTDDALGVARALNSLGIVAYMQGEYDEARQHYQESLSLCRTTGSVSGIARALSNLGMVANATGHYQAAVGPLQESLELRRTLRGQVGLASTLNNLGIALYHLGRVAEARACYQESLDLAREVGSQRDVALGLINLGYIAWEQGQHAEARRHYLECLAIRRKIGDRYGIAYVLNNLGDVALDLEANAEAHENFSEALRIALDVQATPVALESVVGLARLLARRGDVEQAVVWLTVVVQHPATIGEVYDNATQRLEKLRVQLPDPIAARATTQGQALRLEQVFKRVV
jgi:predicted ATPase/DNA-binding SARP family transcriptional activator/Tfp pilus assembly protein PilF